MKNGILYGLLFLFAACDLAKEEVPFEAIARVHDSYLSAEKIADIVPDDATREDSIRITENYIQSWIRQQLIIQQAENNIPEIESKLNQQMEDYRNSLVIFTYENELIKEKMDTLVKDSEIEAYYEANKSNFELKDYILRARYVKVDPESPDLEELKKWAVSDSIDDFDNLKEYCIKYAVSYHLDDSAWMYYDKLEKEIKLEVLNVEDFFKKNDYVEHVDETYLHLLRILDFKLKDNISPLALEREKIRKIILNQRKLRLVKKMRSDIYEEALSKSHFEIYKKP